MLIAHLSDLHVDHENAANSMRLAYLIAELAVHAPDLWLLTGDLTQHGRAEDYFLLQEQLSHCGPVLALPGNHDDAVRVAQLFGHAAPPPQGLRAIAFNDACLRVVLIDSTVPGKSNGHCRSELIEALDEELRRSRLPTLLAMHHPPIDSQMPVMAPYELESADTFINCVKGHDHVVGVLAGHHHKVQFAMLGRDCPVIIAPSTAPGLPLDFAATEFHAHPAPPSALLHRWDGGTLRTHLFLPVTPFGTSQKEHM